MAKRRRSSEQEKADQLVREQIERSTEPGPRRDALLFRAFCSKERVPNPRVFMEQEFWLDDKKTAVPVQWVFNRPQRLLDYLIWRHERAGKMFRAVILKSRQWGISSYFVGKGLERALRNEHARCAIVADKDETAAALLERGKLILRQMKYDLPLVRNNVSELRFDEPFNSRVAISSSRRAQPLRGQTAQFCHCSEMPFWSDPEKKLRGINQAVPKAPGTLLSHEYTANGIENFGYHFWDLAKKKKNEYMPLFFPWWMDPKFDYTLKCSKPEATAILETLDDEELWLVKQGLTVEQLNWRRNTIENECFGDIDTFHQEYPGTADEAFLASGRAVFPTKLVMLQMRKCVEPIFEGMISGGKDNIVLTPSRKGEFRQWERPRRDRNYVCAVDPSHGIEGGDPAAFVIIEILTGKVVATYNAIAGPEILGREVAAACWLYNDAYCMPEITGVGRAVLTSIRDAGYHNIAWQPTFDVPGKAQNRRYGWSTDHASKPNLVLEGRSLLALGDDCPPIQDERICQQMTTFVIDPQGRYNAATGKHDDLLIAFLIAHVARRDVISNGLVEVLGAPKYDNSPEGRHWAEWHRQTDERTQDEWDEYFDEVI